jgi:AraC-like DNA-binding protein
MTMSTILPTGLDGAELIARRVGGTAVERPHDQPPHGVPLALRSAQHSFVSKGRFESPRSARTVLLKWLIKGKAAMDVQGRRHTMRAGDLGIYLPMIPHRFWALQSVNEFCWMSLDGPLAEQFVMTLDLRPGVYGGVTPPVKEIHTLMRRLKDYTIQGRRRASLAAITLLYRVADGLRTKEVATIVRRAEHIIQQEFSNPALAAGLIANRLGYHRGSLSRLFHQQTGLTLMDYITQVRLQEARTLLTHTQEKAGEICHQCGFEDLPYFCRWLKKHTGQTPGELRDPSKLS